MKQRCYNPKNLAYKNYGGRGIKVCDRWLENFDNFYQDMGNKPSIQHTIERIDNDGNYEPKNCRWATKQEQVNNCRSNINITYNGKTQNLTQWSKELNIKFIKLYKRLKRDWSVEDTFNIKIADKHKPRKFLYYEGKTSSLEELSNEHNISKDVLKGRLSRGWNLEKALKEPIEYDDRILEYNGKSQCINKWAKEFNIKPITLYKRLFYGWSLEKALTTPIDIKKRNKQ